MIKIQKVFTEPHLNVGTNTYVNLDEKGNFYANIYVKNWLKVMIENQPRLMNRQEI